MEEYNYDYNSDRNEKIDYKCPNCGHRLVSASENSVFKK